MRMDQRSAACERGAIVSLWGLLGLFLMKGTVGWLTGSKALIADACQSAADLVGTATSYFGLRKGRLSQSAAPQSQAQPGSSLAIVMSAILIVVGLEAGISSIRAVAEGVDEAPGWGAVVVIAASIGIREGLVRYKRKRDNECGIREDRHGDNRSDIFASLTALVGTSGAVAGEMFDMPFLYVLDPAAGLVISVFVVRMGYRLTAGVLRKSTVCAIDEVDSQTLLESVQRIDGVVAVEDLKAREHGHYIVLDVTVRVNPRITVAEGQEIGLRVKRHLTKRFQHIIDANIHIQPYDPGYPYKSNHQDEELSTFLQ
ncbi:cation diffusion facilitator family transporter [Cohnella yongneupensis]|uniref:Cation diffusion facilitator family transporter n=1 Tax=Cohnella yongneupensis TaxID=425006 RepID=A0ABW0R082_9BACL